MAHRLTLDFRQQRRDIATELSQGGLECGAEAVGEHEVEQLVHVFREGLTDRLGEHADALEDGLLRRCALLSALHQALLDAAEDRIEVRRHRRLDLHRDVTDGEERGGPVAVVP
jgi:hypothetical protein